eukprot:6663-Heterococcus_DN1.PRE.3
MPILWHAITATSRAQPYAAHRSHCLLLLLLLTHLTLLLTNTATTTTASSSVANGAISVASVQLLVVMSCWYESTNCDNMGHSSAMHGVSAKALRDCFVHVVDCMTTSLATDADL